MILVKELFIMFCAFCKTASANLKKASIPWIKKHFQN